MKIMVINGPNINMLGVREPEVYGQKTYADLEKYRRLCRIDRGGSCGYAKQQRGRYNRLYTLRSRNAGRNSNKPRCVYTLQLRHCGRAGVG